MATLNAVLIGTPQTLDLNTRTVRTGIFKEPVHGPVQITMRGLLGDAVLDTRHHGGDDQAVYLYLAEDYTWWRAHDASQPYDYGTFGENMVIEGLADAQLCVGDRLQLGSVELELTAPRIPCSVQAARIGDPHYVKTFRDAARPGVYARVLTEGTVEAGDRVAYQGRGTLSMERLFRVWYARPHDVDLLRAYLKEPLAVRWKQRFLEWIEIS